MAKNKIGLEFSGWKELLEKLDMSGGDIEEAVEKSLEVASKTVSTKISQDMKRHHRTGRTEKSIIQNPEIEWEGQTANVGIGFDFNKGGLTSVFLMYGTPRSKPDKKIYNDIYGAKVKKEIGEKQEEIFQDMLAKRFGG